MLSLLLQTAAIVVTLQTAEEQSANCVMACKTKAMEKSAQCPDANKDENAAMACAEKMQGEIEACVKACVPKDTK